MIQFTDKIFLLHGKNYSYVMGITETGYVEHLHYGGKITVSDLEYLSEIGKTTAPQKNDMNGDGRFNDMPGEKGAPALQGLPHVRKGDETLVVTLKDDFSDIAVDLYYTVSDDSNVLVRNAVIRNTGTESVMLKKAFSFRMELPNGGTWAQERIPEIAPIAHGVTRLHSLRGASSHQTKPFM